MDSSGWIELSKSLAWPIVGLLALIYVWSSDAIGKLLKISGAVKELRDRLGELVKVEESLRGSISSIGEITTTIEQIQSGFLSMKADVENIRDRVDLRPVLPAQSALKSLQTSSELNLMFSEMQSVWQELTTELIGRFGWFDGRSTGSAAYRFTHGNRKGIRLTGEQADEIARLHSSMKSYVRRQSSLSDWLDDETKDEFVNACSAMTEQIRKLA